MIFLGIVVIIMIVNVLKNINIMTMIKSQLITVTVIKEIIQLKHEGTFKIDFKRSQFDLLYSKFLAMMKFAKLKKKYSSLDKKPLDMSFN
jgi:hypothetical protein